MNIFLISDHHFGHPGVCKFLREDTTKLRPWDNPDEMDEFMVEKHNSVVRSQDKVYFLGDVVIKRQHLEILSRLKGKKVLVRGNHDIFKLTEYAKYFYDIRGTHKLDSFILSHYPIHPDSLPSWAICNVHGHLHHREVKDDPRYINVSVERVNYTPISLEELRGIAIERRSIF